MRAPNFKLGLANFNIFGSGEYKKKIGHFFKTLNFGLFKKPF